jgi:hypothetical protein
MDRLMWRLGHIFRLHARLKRVQNLEHDPKVCDDACDGPGG